MVISIFIGRDPASSALAIFVDADGQRKIADVSSVPIPNSVSRINPQNNTAHCQIDIDSQGMTITNLKSTNVTSVDGLQVQSKRINESSKITLGSGNYLLDLTAVLNVASKLTNFSNPLAQPSSNQTPTNKPYSITHLKNVWNDQKEARRKVQEKQRQINLIRTGCGIFTMCAMPCIFLFGPFGYFLTAIGIAGNIYSFVGLKNTDPNEQYDKINEDFQRRYVCPNCDCFLGNMSYEMIIRQYKDKCPYCKCQFVH